jgi:hypothetical protein
VRRLYVALAATFFAGPARAEEPEWKAAAPLTTSLVRNGETVETGTAFDWIGIKTEPAAKLGPLLPLPRPAPEGTTPQALPETLTETKGPALPPVPTSRPVIVIPTAEPRQAATPELPRRVVKEAFASNEIPRVDPVPSAAPVKVHTPPKVSVYSRPQPLAPRPGQRTILSDFFSRP